MSRKFGGTSGTYIRSEIPTNYPITGYPFTIASFVKPHSAHNGVIITIIDKSESNRYWNIELRDATGIKAAMAGRNPTTRRLVGTTALSSDKWYSIVGVFRSATDRELYLDGVSDGTDTLTATEAAAGELDRITIGRLDRPADTLYCDADIAQCIADNFEWSSGEIVQYSQGIIPKRPHSFHQSLNHIGSLEPDLSGRGNHGKVTGTKPDLHPPQIKPEIIQPPWYLMPAAAAAGLSIPIAMHHYKQMMGAN